VIADVFNSLVRIEVVASLVDTGHLKTSHGIPRRGGLTQ
jgi:hypothetical protein